MREIRLINEEELETFVTITTNAYPGMEIFTQADRSRLADRLWQAAENPLLHLYGLFEDGQMRGVMRLYDFTMNLLSTKALVGGVGGVAVDLLHKKEKVAADMLRFFLDYYRQKGACLTALYPFRPDFYNRMGFGYGTKMNMYRFSPDSIPMRSSKQDVFFLSEKDREAIRACYDRYFERINGIIERFSDVWDAFLTNPKLHTLGVKRDGRLTGYLVYKFEKGQHPDFLSNNIVIQELVYENADALWQLLSYIRSQADQIEHIVLTTQDDNFYHLLSDPRYGSKKRLPGVIAHESSLQGVGIMYRVIGIPQLFETLRDHNFGGVTCRLKIDLTDTFMPRNNGGWTINIRDGQARVIADDGFDVAIQLDVSDFSSMIVGTIGFSKLHSYGLADISDPDMTDQIDRLFSAPEPICLTQF